ncbi:transcriptional regulator [Paenibacillus sp. y28]|uniref:transcriptional regulator n=1 Tax=Paenibacillus sp. y28 TaxID=3129110 RepID=UPI003019F8BC
MVFNKEQFAELLLAARGSRTMNKYSMDSGVDAGYISRLSRGLIDSAPSAAIIRKLADSAQNGVKVEDFMHAAGYMDAPGTAEPDVPSWATTKDKRDLRKMLEEDEIMFDGMPLSSEDKQRIQDVLTGLFWEAKQMNKRKKPQ